MQRIFRGITAGVVATLLLWVLELTRGAAPRLETIALLDEVSYTLHQAARSQGHS